MFVQIFKRTAGKTEGGVRYTELLKYDMCSEKWQSLRGDNS